MKFRDWDRFLRRYMGSNKWHVRRASRAIPDNGGRRGGAPRDKGDLPLRNGSALASEETSKSVKASGRREGAAESRPGPCRTSVISIYDRRRGAAFRG